MQDTDPFFDPQQIMYRVAKEVWPDLDTRFHELFTQFDSHGQPVPTYHGEPIHETVTWGFSEGDWLIRPGVQLHNDNHIFIQFASAFVSVDQWGDVYRYALRRNRYERRLAAIVADVIRDMRSDAEPIHVQAEEHNREFWG
jgi:glutamine synthetase type III